MSDARASSYRLQLGMLLALVTMLALGSFWLLDVVRRGMDDSQPAAKRTEPDYYIEQFNFVRMAKTGQVRYHISGARMTHNPQDDSYDIQQPIIKSLSTTQPAMTVVAERGRADINLSQVQLFNEVKMNRPASATAQALHMTSDYLLVLPDEDVMKTHRPVRIAVGNSTLSGIGMFANNATRELKLAAQVNGTFPPQVAH